MDSFSINKLLTISIINFITKNLQTLKNTFELFKNFTSTSILSKVVQKQKYACKKVKVRNVGMIRILYFNRDFKNLLTGIHDDTRARSSVLAPVEGRAPISSCVPVNKFRILRNC